MAEVLPQLLTPEEAADLATLESEQVYRWIADDKVPYIETPPDSGNFRLPMHGFLSSLPNLVDFNADLEALHIAADEANGPN